MLYCNSTKYGAWIIQSDGWFNKTQKLHDINSWYKCLFGTCKSSLHFCQNEAWMAPLLDKVEAKQ